MLKIFWHLFSINAENSDSPYLLCEFSSFNKLIPTRLLSPAGCLKTYIPAQRERLQYKFTFQYEADLPYRGLEQDTVLA